MELLATHARRLILMSEGKILLDGQPREVLHHTGAFREAGVRLPQVVELADRLKDEVAWPDVPLTEAEAEAALRGAA